MISMKIAIDVSPLESGHAIRGVGFYLANLQKSLQQYFPENEYIFFREGEKIADDIDLVHYPFFDPFSLTIPFVKKHKTIVTVHDLIPIIFPEHFPAGIKGNIRWQMQKYNLRKIDGIIVNSQATKIDLLKIVGVQEEKIGLTYLAAGEAFKEIKDARLRNEIIKKYNLPEKFALYVGDATWNKNVPMLLEAIEKVDVPLVIAGKALAEENIDTTNVWNNSLVASQQLISQNKKILNLGFVPTEDLVQLYNIATVFVFPSLYEGFGLPVVEAMQSGCPVITTKGGSLEEIGGEGVYYVENNVADLATAITTVMSSESLQNSLTKKGLEQARKYTWQKTASQTVAFYQKIQKQI